MSPNRTTTKGGKRLEHSNTPQDNQQNRPEKRSNGDSNGENGTRTVADASADSASLREDPHLLARVADVIKARGYAGDVRPSLLIYLALTSRFLERPVNVSVLGESSAGKNYAVDAALALHPPEAVHVVSAASPMAMVYSKEVFTHRFVVFQEADSLYEDGTAGSLIRSLVNDNKMIYDVVQPIGKDGAHETDHKVKQGPTGLITTSTKTLGHQLNTRVFEVVIPDDTNQTRAIMEMQAELADLTAESRPSVDLRPFVALQEWLAECGTRRVTIPFSIALSGLVPASAVRMRRDFPRLLAIIKAAALLHQCQRERLSDGTVVATLEDYAQVREILGSIFEAVQLDGLTPAVRETVEAVPLGHVVASTRSESQLAKELKVSKSTIAWRVKKAIQGGWLINDEKRPGYPAQLVRGADLPDETTALPTVEQLREAFESKNTVRGSIRTVKSATFGLKSREIGNRSSVRMKFGGSPRGLWRKIADAG
jgi:hypothetical protein